ncbi:MAG: thioredoxin [Polyangiaceae bacterium]|jgi:thioredoxin 1|nr:thioredoxin [Polyangiaceae bacterium]
MAGNIVELTDENFENEVIKSNVPVLVDFTATWCGPCKALAPIVEGLANEAGGRYKVAKLDIDDASDTARKYRVMSVPTVLVFQGGQVKGQHVGLTNKETLLKLIG